MEGIRSTGYSEFASSPVHRERSAFHVHEAETPVFMFEARDVVQ
jgi:hypothetical protein